MKKRVHWNGKAEHSLYNHHESYLQEGHLWACPTGSNKKSKILQTVYNNRVTLTTGSTTTHCRNYVTFSLKDLIGYDTVTLTCVNIESELWVIESTFFLIV